MLAAWMQYNWGYLLHDNVAFWVPYLDESCNAIKWKLSDEYNVDVDDRFCIAQFIDCVIIPSSRV